MQYLRGFSINNPHDKINVLNTITPFQEFVFQMEMEDRIKILGTSGLRFARAFWDMSAFIKANRRSFVNIGNAHLKVD